MARTAPINGACYHSLLSAIGELDNDIESSCLLKQVGERIAKATLDMRGVHESGKLGTIQLRYQNLPHILPIQSRPGFGVNFLAGAKNCGVQSSSRMARQRLVIEEKQSVHHVLNLRWQLEEGRRSVVRRESPG
jgi:hypothetical protein